MEGLISNYTILQYISLDFRYEIDSIGVYIQDYL